MKKHIPNKFISKEHLLKTMENTFKYEIGKSKLFCIIEQDGKAAVDIRLWNKSVPTMRGISLWLEEFIQLKQNFYKSKINFINGKKIKIRKDEKFYTISITINLSTHIQRTEYIKLSNDEIFILLNNNIINFVLENLCKKYKIYSK